MKNSDIATLTDHGHLRRAEGGAGFHKLMIWKSLHEAHGNAREEECDGGNPRN
jgi:hypothetical protein